MNPTSDQYNAFQKLFTYFNTRLFEDSLPDVFLNFSRKKGAAGFFAANRWKYVDGKLAHEISINPTSLADGKQELIQTLVHEMCHLWQREFGKPSRRTYHNQEWADKMESLGLMPSHTGRPGGNRTGQKMSDYLIDGGPLDTLISQVPDDHWLPLIAIEKEQRPKPVVVDENLLADMSIDGQTVPVETSEDSKKKVKYTCPSCRINVWGKSALNIHCGDCKQSLEVQ